MQMTDSDGDNKSEVSPMIAWALKEMIRYLVTAIENFMVSLAKTSILESIHQIRLSVINSPWYYYLLGYMKVYRKP